MSLISSSSAVCFPVKTVAEWTHERGGRLILDAAHGPGHVPLDPEGWGVDAMFGTIHKWYPTMRPVGLLWMTDKFAEHVRPAEVSLTWDSGDLVERFSWPGTFDPIPRLTVDAAIEEWHEWQASGALDRCRDLADAATRLLSDAGGVPTASPEFSPPRLRAFIFNGIARQQLKETLIRAGLRAWVGPGTDGECILRISTHVYNDLSDVEAVVAQLPAVHREGAAR
jgi:isopenicillin-N epimerase